MPNKWARSYQLSMSTLTQAGNLSMPNQWAQSRQLLITIPTKAANLSMPNNGHDLISYQCQH